MRLVHTAAVTPDGRYIVVEGNAGPRLWRASNPNLSELDRQRFVTQLMNARRAVRAARGDAAKLADARQAVNQAKQALGERGRPWWTDGAPDLNRVLVRNSPYRDWWLQRSGDHA